MYDKFKKLCEIKNVTPYRVSKETGIQTSTLSDWKNGKSTPKLEKLQKIADFFGVSVEYFTSEEENKMAYYYNEETAEIAQEIFENKELKALFDASRDASPEDLKTVHTMLMALKNKERGDVD